LDPVVSPQGKDLPETVVFETEPNLNSRVNPNTLHNMSCKNF
jgi:hypothetical protein